MRLHLAFPTSIALAISSICMPLAAQDAGSSDEAEATKLFSRAANADIFNFSYGVPDSPALALSGLSASDVTQTNQLKTFVVTLPEFESGETALAFDYTPLGTLLGPAGPEGVKISEYRKWGWLGQTAAKTRISWIGRNGVDGSDPEKASKALMSLGASWSLLSSSDPLLLDGNDIEACREFRDDFARSFHDQRTSGRFLSPVQPIYNDLRFASGSLRALKNKDADIILEGIGANIRLLLGASDRLISFNAQVGIDEDIQLKINRERLETILSQAQASVGQREVLYTLAASAAEEADRVSNKLNGTDAAAYTRASGRVTEGDVDLASGCQEAIDKKLKRAANWDVGLAHVWRGETDGFSDFEVGGHALWTSVRVPLFNSDGEKDSYWVLGGTARWGFDEIVSTGDETTPDGKAETVSVWGGLEYFAEKWRAGARYGWVETDYADTALDAFSSDGERWLINADYNIAPNIWLSATYGEADGTVDALRGEQLSVGLKFSSPTALNFFE